LARNRGRFKGRKKPNTRKDYNKYDSKARQRTSMLSQRAIVPFKYDLKNIFSQSDTDEETSLSIIATVIAKGTRISLKEAKMYVCDMEDSGSISQRTSEDIRDLLDRYSKYR
jgi:hypothetical protein